MLKERIVRAIAAATLAIVLLAPGASDAADSTLRLHGSNTIGEKLAPALVRSWGEAAGWTVGALESTAANESRMFLTRGQDTLGVEIRAHGTGTGLEGLIAGSADLWMASRPAKNEEVVRAASLGRLDAPAQEHVIGLDGLAIIVHPDSALSGLDVSQVRSLFSGEIRDWAQLGLRRGAVRLYARDDKSGTFDSFKSMVMGDTKLSASARRFESTNELAAAVLADRDGIGFVSIAGVGGAKALALSELGTRALAPARHTVATEDYVLSRRLFLYSPSGVSPVAAAFVEFAQGLAGQRVVEQVGFVSQAIVPIAVDAREDIGPEYAELTRNARRLSVNFRFDTGISYMDGKALRDLDRLALFARQSITPAQELVLIGFSDAHEVNPYQAVAVSVDRADYVAAELLGRGVAPRRVRGVGDIAPVASNQSDLGGARNRRVEVWLREPTATLSAASTPTSSARLDP